MQSKFAEVTPRNFNPMSAAGLSDEARKAVNAAFDAMSTGASRPPSNSEKNSEQVIEKMAAAARAGMAGANRRCHPCANAGYHQNADPNDGSE